MKLEAQISIWFAARTKSCSQFPSRALWNGSNIYNWLLLNTFTVHSEAKLQMCLEAAPHSHPTHNTETSMSRPFVFHSCFLCAVAQELWGTASVSPLDTMYWDGGNAEDLKEPSWSSLLCHIFSAGSNLSPQEVPAELVTIQLSKHRCLAYLCLDESIQLPIQQSLCLTESCVIPTTP